MMPYLKHLNGLNIIKIYYEAKKKSYLYYRNFLSNEICYIINSCEVFDALSNFYNVKFFVPNISMDRDAISENYNLRNKIKFENLIGQNGIILKQESFLVLKL